MAHVAPVYPNFARGEVSPLMFGRIDIEQYPTCLDKCRNVYIRPYGCATRLTGTEFVSDTKNSGKVRLLKFIFSATDSYIIECGAGYFRFYQNGGLVLKTNAPAWVNGTVYKKGDFVEHDSITYYCLINHTASGFDSDLAAEKWIEQDIYEVPNDYYEDQLDSIQYVQLDDIIKLVCLPHNNDNSTARPKELIRNSSDNWTFQDVTFKETPYLDQNVTNITMTPSAVTGNITITASSSYFDSQMVGSNMWIGTKVKDTTTNKDIQGFVTITAFTDSTHVSATVQSKLSGTSATTIWGEGAFSDFRGYPAVVALYDGRLYYARTPYQPRNVYGSKPYAYETFTPAVDNEDDAGINIQLATNANGDGSDIKWMIGASYLLCGTYGGEFVIRGTGDGAITATDISARQRTNWGGEPVQPIVAGTFVHFLQRNGNKLRQFQYDFYYDSYKAVDVSIFSEHLLASPIKEMALQKNPDSIIYLMREDGKVVMLTLEQDQSVQAWSILEELGATVESIQTIPSYDGNYDEVYMVMKRSALETSLTTVSSNPAVIVTNDYTGTKTKGIETIIITYNSENGVWTNPNSVALNTKLNVVSSNPSVIPSTSYSGIKQSAGTLTETLVCTSSFYALDSRVFKSGNPIIDENGVVNHLSADNYIIIPSSTFSSIIKFTTDELDNDSALFEYPYQARQDDDWQSLFVNTHNNKLQIILGSTLAEYTLSANTDYYFKCIGVVGQYGQVRGVHFEISTDGVTYTTIYTNNSAVAFLYKIGAHGDCNCSVDLLNSEYQLLDDSPSIPFVYLDHVWLSQTTGKTVSITSPNYAITLTGMPNIGDTLTCTWNTITGYVNTADLDLTITGTPNNNDTITLTYTSDFTAPVRYIERMLNPVTPDNQNNWWYVRSGLKYDGFKLTEGINLTLTSNIGQATASASSSIFKSSMVGNRIRFIDSDYNVLGEGKITEYINSTTVIINITTYFQSSTIEGGKWGISTDSISGLHHLNSRTVQVYADCIEQGNKIVSDGSIVIDDAFIAVVGLPYQSYITTMPMEAGSQNGTAVGKRKRISEMAIRVWNSIGVRVGRDLDHLYDTIYQQKEPFTGVIPNIKYNQGWVWDANITVEQSHPYPMNILSIAPIVTEVDK